MQTTVCHVFCPKDFQLVLSVSRYHQLIVIAYSTASRVALRFTIIQCNCLNFYIAPTFLWQLFSR